MVSSHTQPAQACDISQSDPPGLEPSRSSDASAAVADDGGAITPVPAPPALGRGISQADLLQQLVSEFRPQGVIETTWCRDIALLMADAARLRKIRDAYRLLAKREAQEAVLGKFLDADPTLSLPRKIRMIASYSAALISNEGPASADLNQAPREAAVLDEAKAHLGMLGYSEQGLMAQGYMDRIEAFDRIEKLIVLTESRRDILIAKLERRSSMRDARLDR